MFVENAYPHDTRVKNEADVLTDAGYAVTVIALRKAGQTSSAVVDGIQVYRLPRLELFQKTPVENPTLSQRLWIKVKSAARISQRVRVLHERLSSDERVRGVQARFDVIHAHNPPDTLFLVALPYTHARQEVCIRSSRSLPGTVSVALRCGP